MRGEPILTPITIDNPALFRLSELGYRWSEGQTGGVRYRWLLPPGWVSAASLPSRGRSSVEPLLGVGDRGGEVTAVLGVLRGFPDSPRQLLERGAAPDASITVFTSRAGPVGERIERRDGHLSVTTAHAFSVASEPYRFLISVVSRRDDEDAQAVLRIVGSALSLADTLTDVRLGRLDA